MARKDLENAEYASWLLATPEERTIHVEPRLRNLLCNHAQAVMFATLRRRETALTDEAVNRVMLNLPTFKGEGLFTTWAHGIIMNVAYDQRRTERVRREVSMEIPGFDLPGEPNAAVLDMLLTVQQLLPSEDYDLFDLLILQGLTQEEVAQQMKETQSQISRKWNKIAEVLKNAFTK